MITDLLTVDSLPSRLPELEKLLLDHRLLTDRICRISAHQKRGVSMQVVTQNANNEVEHINLVYSESFPPELQIYFHDYATRLCAECWLIEAKISQVKKEAGL